jgi:hypothetical protein
MITVNRKGAEVKVTFHEDFYEPQSASKFCENISDAQDLASVVKKAIKEGYGFAQCRAILESDKLDD